MQAELLRQLDAAREREHWYHETCLLGGPMRKAWRRLARYPRYTYHLLARLGLYPRRPVWGATFWGAPILLPLGDRDAIQLYLLGLPAGGEYDLTRYLLRALTPGDVFYDVGASYGFYTLLAREVITEGEVHAFEPNPRTFRCLEASTRGPGAFVNPVALGDAAGAVTLYDQIPLGHSGASTLCREKAAAEKGGTAHGLSVMARTLDEYCSAHRPPTFLKLDVEGAESSVLRGGRDCLRRGGVTLCMEVSGGALGERLSAPALRLLYDWGYKSYRIAAEGGPELAHPVDPRRDVGPGQVRNFIFRRTAEGA